MTSRAGRWPGRGALLLGAAFAGGAALAGGTVRIAGKAELDLAPGAHHAARAGIDSTVGVISGPGYECLYDLGVYADRLEGRAGTQALSIAGKPARLVRSGDFMGLHITGLGRGGLGVSGLTISCTGAGIAGNGDVETMLRGVRLTP